MRFILPLTCRTHTSIAEYARPVAWRFEAALYVGGANPLGSDFRIVSVD
jgi:hypothetical protein